MTFIRHLQRNQTNTEQTGQQCKQSPVAANFDKDETRRYLINDVIHVLKVCSVAAMFAQMLSAVSEVIVICDQ